MREPLDIAIIGMAGVYAGSRNVAAYWQNILSHVYSVSEASEEWSRGVLDPDSKAPNRIYTAQGGWLHDLAEFDPREFGVMPNAVDGREPDHFLALKNARDALADSGYLDKPFNHERAGIILGRGNNTNRGAANLLAHGTQIDQMVDIVKQVRPDFSAAELDRLREGLTKQLPPFNPEMLPGLIPNVTTGVIANRLDLMGPNCIVDAACASSLVALEQAVRELTSGRCDLMLTGGVHAQTPPQSYMIFSQINALSRGRIRPFQKGANGTLLGEGCGVLALKRLADAERAGDRIYAVIKGIGVASDGKAKGLFAPRKEGQVVALRRAYESCGIDPLTIGLMEAHATGIALGDRTEVSSLKEVFGGRRNGIPTVALGSVKSMISHAIPASGAASLIKCALALQQKVLPPMLCEEPAPELELENSPFYINNQTRPWVHGGSAPRRAGVNAFGFGGINAHVILEEHRPRERIVQVQVLHSPVDSELVMLGAADLATLLTQVRQLRARLDAPGAPVLAVIAKACAARAGGEHRLAIVAHDLGELRARLDQAIEKLARTEVKPFKTRSGLHYGCGSLPGKLAFLFPGEGAQYPGMLADVCVSYPQVREWFDFIEQTAYEGQLTSRAAAIFPPPTTLDANEVTKLNNRLVEEGDLAAESVFAASMGMFDLMSDLGLKPDGMLGHSTGENTAMTAARVRRYDGCGELAQTIHHLNRIYRELDAQGLIAQGTLLTLGALRPEQRAHLLAGAGKGIDVAMDNCPNQLVLFGPVSEMAALKAELSAEGVMCAELPFGRAYHTALFNPIADAYRSYFAELEFGEGIAPLYSACTAAPFPLDAPAIRELAAAQWEHPVRFTETVQRMYDDGYRVFVEIGPSGNLTSFVSDVLRDAPDVVAVASNSRRKSGVNQLHTSLAQLWAAGANLNPRALFDFREIADFDLDAPAVAPAVKQKLSLMMPRMSWPSDMTVPPLPTVTVSVPAAAPAPAAPAYTPVAAAPALAASTDPRAQALQTHFALMQEFLDSQARMLGLASGQQQAPTPPTAHVPTPAISQDDPARYPLLGAIVERGEQKLVMERTLDLARDLFLRDHTIGSTPSAHDANLLPIPVLPFTFSMEIMAQAGARVLARDDLFLIGLEQCRGSRWLSLDDGRLPLRIVAERITSREGVERVAGRIYVTGANAPPGGVLVFEATALYAAQYPQAPAAKPWSSQDSQAARNNPDGELYAHGMFHGPRLQGVKHLRRWGEQSIEADLATIPVQDYFSFTPSPQFQFDAALLDAAGQLAGYWLTEKHTWGFNCFPYRVGNLKLYAPPPRAGAHVLCRAQLGFTEEHLLEAHFDLIGADGQLIMRADRWEDRKFAMPSRLYDYRLKPQERFLSEPWLGEQLPAGFNARRVEPLPGGFLDEGGGIWKRMLAHMVLNAHERPRYYALPATGPRREEWLMGRIAAKEALRDWALREHGLRLASADIEISNDELGRPFATCAQMPGRTLPAISISHSRQWAVALVAPGLPRVGIDYQRLAGLDAALLEAGAFADEERKLLEGGMPEDRLRRSVSLWCAKEAAAKAQGSGLEGQPQAWRVVEAQLDRRVGLRTLARVEHAGRSYDVALHFSGDEEVAAVCDLRKIPAAALSNG